MTNLQTLNSKLYSLHKIMIPNYSLFLDLHLFFKKVGFTSFRVEWLQEKMKVKKESIWKS